MSAPQPAAAPSPPPAIAPAAPPTVPIAPSANDSGTLRISVGVAADVVAGTSKDDVPVHLYVVVMERASGARVSGAVVAGGPVGRASIMVEETGDAGSYDGTATGYDPVWEFSVVRGSDYLKGIRAVGPTYPSIDETLTLGTPGAAVSWSPHGEPSVDSQVCLTDEGPSNDPYAVHDSWCATGADEGVATLASAGPADARNPLPRPGVPYLLDVWLERNADLTLCSHCGVGFVHVGVERELPPL